MLALKSGNLKFMTPTKDNSQTVSEVIGKSATPEEFCQEIDDKNSCGFAARLAKFVSNSQETKKIDRSSQV